MSISNSTAPAHGQRKTAEHALYNVCFSQSAVFPPCQFDLHENEREGGTYFHMNGFACRLVLK